MTGQIIQKVVQKLKRPEEKWYFNATPEMFERFHSLLGLASAYNYSQCKYFDALLSGEYHERPGEKHERIDRETAWRKFQNEIELDFGRIDNDSCSTLATINDNPGTGRLIDKFVYQPIGRSIERLFHNLELRYSHPPEKSACQIKQFIEGTVYFGNRILDDKINAHRFHFYNTFGDDVDFNEVCVSLFMEISRKEKVAKAFQRLLMQASSKHRSLRVEAQKQIWSLIRYENMIFILNAITDLESLIWDGYTTTFQHCSPLDPDFQTHIRLIGEMNLLDDHLLVDISTNPPMGLLHISKMRDILETCAQENRGFSSLPINLVMRLLVADLDTYIDHEDQKLEDTEKFAKNLYLALIAITGFLNEFSYVSELLSAQICEQYMFGRLESVLLPLWGQDRTESDINALELMVHFMINLIGFEGIISEPYAVKELEYYIVLLNDADKGQGTMSRLEARASEDYLRKVTEGFVQRGPISFAMFKDMVTNPLIWEKYRRPEHQNEATDKSRVSTTWEYKLCIYAAQFWKSPILFYHSIPFSDSFQPERFDDIFRYIRNRLTLGDFAGPVDAWFRIQKWLEELKDDSMALPCHWPGTKLYDVMKWWRSYDIHKEMSPISQLVPPQGSFAQPQLRSNGETTTLPSPCQCGICKRSSHVPDKNKNGTLQPSLKELYFPPRTADFSSQHRRQHNTATESSPLPSRSGFLKRKLEELEPRPQIVPLPRRYRDSTAEDSEPGSLGPVRKKQRTSHSLESDASDVNSIITEIDVDSTESDTGSEDAMSVDEDFWSAKSRLSLLAIED